MKEAQRRGAVACLFAIVLLAGTGRAADFPPTDHGGADLILANGDVIWGVQSNVNRFVVPAGATVLVKPYNGDPVTGILEVQALDIEVSGTIQAWGGGFPGGPGGGGGGGASLITFGTSVFTGSGGPGGSAADSLGSDGSGGMDGQGAQDITGSAVVAGGPGGAGARGVGTAAGNGGTGGSSQVAADGSAGFTGQNGGYLVAGGNGDSTSNADVLRGSGGGGGGGAGGGGGPVGNSQGRIAGGGGGGGGAGGLGGGAVKLYAINSIAVSGTIDTRGTDGGENGAPGSTATVSVLNTIGGDGGAGANSTLLGESVAAENTAAVDIVDEAAALLEIDLEAMPDLTVGAVDKLAQTTDAGLGGRGGHGSESLADGVVGDGGNGGRGGGGGGGGILLYCLMADGMDLTGATLDARGGRDQLGNGGTIKIFFDGLDPTVDAAAVLAGRVLKEAVLGTREWRRYR